MQFFPGLLQQPVVVALLDKQRGGDLVVARDLANHQPLQLAQLLNHWRRGDDEADAQPRRQQLGQTAEVDHPIPRIGGLERWQGAAVVFGFGVVIVLENHLIVHLRMVKQCLAPRQAHGHSGGALITGSAIQVVASRQCR